MLYLILCKVVSDKRFPLFKKGLGPCLFMCSSILYSNSEYWYSYINCLETNYTATVLYNTYYSDFSFCSSIEACLFYFALEMLQFSLLKGTLADIFFFFFPGRENLVSVSNVVFGRYRNLERRRSCLTYSQILGIILNLFHRVEFSFYNCCSSIFSCSTRSTTIEWLCICLPSFTLK